MDANRRRFTPYCGLLACGICVVGAAPPEPLAVQAQRKIDLIQNNQAPRGTVYRFGNAELNAWARFKAPQIVPNGFRQMRLEMGEGRATAYALVDFLKVRDSKGVQTNWLVAKLIEGEKTLKVEARIQSAAGKATVYLDRVEIGGVAVHGAPLDFLVENFFLPFYPEAKINQPFALAGSLDHIEVHASEARAVVKR